jgi:serine/threonine protein kinase
MGLRARVAAGGDRVGACLIEIQAMQEDSHESLRLLFEQVIDLPARERVARLDRACSPSLRPRLEAMLAAAEAHDSFLADPPPGAAPTLATPLAEAPGAMIGRYELLEQIGEGGFGVVFLVEQREPVHRRVALKIIKLGMDTKAVIARFEAERQALAMMDHPNIARVLEAGATETGRPYFVMELVKGEPITRYCDALSLDIPERLALFTQVCHAVQHAHSKGVIHRDLKPSNILVSTQDGHPLAKVIDFGIAKATDHRLTERTLFTEHRALIGTPEYMSPEQAEGSLDIDTRSDVYALGVLLYELLTGATPFDAQQLRAAAYGELQRIIREEEPPKPSTRVSTLATIDQVATQRQAEPRKLGTLLRGELDWIVMKCLEKDRTRRYETSSGLAADVQRHLDGEPVVAAPPSKRYRARKLLWRYRVPVAVASAFALLLIGATGVSLRFWQQAEANAAEGKRQLGETELAATLLANMIGQSEPDEKPIPNELMRQRLDRFAATLEPRLAGHPEVDARVRVALGSAYCDIGEWKQAELHVERALATYRELYGPVHPRVEVALHLWAWLIHQRGDYAAAVELYRNDLAMCQELLGDEHPMVARSMDNLARVLDEKGDYDEGKQWHLKALAMRRKLLGDEHPEVAASLYNLAGSFAGKGDNAAAVPLLLDALAIAHHQQPESGAARCALLKHHLALCLCGMGRPAEALQPARESVAMYREHLGKADFEQAHALKVLAECLYAMRELDEAEKVARESVEIYRENEAWSRQAREFHGDAVQVLAKTLLDAGKPDEAILIRREFADDLRRLLPADDVLLANALSSLGTLLIDHDRNAEAEPALRECAAIREKALGSDSQDYWLLANARSRLGETLVGQAATMIESDAPAAISKFTEAEPLLIESAEWLISNADRIPKQYRARRLRESLERVVSLYDRWDAIAPETGKADRAAEWRAQLQELEGS